MKVAVIGAGNVGKTIFHDLQYLNMISQITLVGRSIEKIKAEVMDARDAACLREEYGPKLYYGGYEATEGADVIVFAAGSSKIRTNRMEMLHDNCRITEEIFTEVKKYNKDAIIVCVTNPLDVIILKIQQVMEQDPRKVIGSGTLLESGRLSRYLADLLDLSDKSVYVTVIGEHGASAVALFSTASIMGMSIDDYLKSITDESVALNERTLTDALKKEPFRIFAGKGYTSTGVSAAACRIISAIALDKREILPVSSVLQGEYGIQDIAISVPSIIGRNGIEHIQEVNLTDEEKEGLQASADVVKAAAKEEGLVS